MGAVLGVGLALSAFYALLLPLGLVAFYNVQTFLLRRRAARRLAGGIAALAAAAQHAAAEHSQARAACLSGCFNGFCTLRTMDTSLPLLVLL